jgi:hypothetical protein
MWVGWCFLIRKVEAESAQELTDLRVETGYAKLKKVGIPGNFCEIAKVI